MTSDSILAKRSADAVDDILNGKRGKDALAAFRRRIVELAQEKGKAMNDPEQKARDLEGGVMLLHAVLLDVRDKWREYDMDERTNTLLMMLMTTLGQAGSKIDRTTRCFEDWGGY